MIKDGFADSGMTQEALARASGVPRSTLANILSPGADPRLIHVEQLVRIALAMDVDVRDWVGELEARERQRRGGQVAPLAARTSRGGRPAEVQRRAARRTRGRSTLGEE